MSPIMTTGSLREQMLGSFSSNSISAASVTEDCGHILDKLDELSTADFPLVDEVLSHYLDVWHVGLGCKVKKLISYLCCCTSS